ncbi:UNVERIFIED_CONTAM: hypothetical protein RMT77_012079 [Armadillidium vulgare]
MKIDNGTKDLIRRAVNDVHLKSNSDAKDLNWYITQLCNSLEREFQGRKVFSPDESRINPSSIIIPGVCVIEVKNESRTSYGWTDSKNWINVNSESLFLPGVVVNFALGRNPCIDWYCLDDHNKAVKENATEEIILEKPLTEEEKRKKLFPKVAAGAAAAGVGITALTVGLRSRTRRNRRNK